MSGPSHRRVAEAIDDLRSSAGWFQLLVEEVVRAMDPGRYAALNVPGRNTSLMTTPPWPDLYSVDDSGSFHVVEATTGDWAGHLEDDVAKVERSALDISSYLFVAWRHTPGPEAVETFTERLGKAGVRETRLIFREELVTLLTQPRFARVCSRTLGVAHSIAPFTTADEAPVFGGASAGAFAPTLDEYRHGLVPRPQLASSLVERLDEAGWALLFGQWGAGKTVLAMWLALASARGWEGYYVDLNHLEGTSAAATEDSLRSILSEGALVIVDNVHLEPGLAHRLFSAWSEFTSGSKLLLVGRTTTPSTIDGRSSPLDEMAAEAIRLVPGPTDFLGVFGRLLARAGRTFGATIDDARRWVDRFGGDLIAFSLATARALDRHAGSAFEAAAFDVDESDALDHVNVKMLSGTTPDQRSALIRLGALSAFEIPGGREVVDPALLDPMIATGLVYRQRLGKGPLEACQFAHPGIGGLILRAEDRPRVDGGTLELVAARGVVVAARLYARLRRSGEDGLAESVGRSGANVDAVARALRWNSVSSVLTALETLRHYVDPLDLPAIDAALVADDDVLRRSVQLTSLGELPHVVRLARKRFPRFLARFVPMLDDVVAPLQRLAAAPQPLDHLAHMFELLRRYRPDAYDELCRGLDADAVIETLGASAVPSFFNAEFLLRRARHAPHGLHRRLIDVFLSDSGRVLLEATLPRAPSDQVAEFFEYADAEAYELSEWLLTWARENAGLLVAKAWEGRPDGLRRLLRVADELDWQLARDLRDAALSEEGREMTVTLLLKGPLQASLGLIEGLARGGAVSPTVLDELLTRATSRERLVRLARAMSLPELASLIRTADGFLPRTQAALLSSTRTDNGDPVTSRVLRERWAPVCSFLRNVPDPGAVLQGITVDEWSSAPNAVARDRPRESTSLATIVGRADRIDLASASAASIMRLPPAAWAEARLTDLAQTFRMASGDGGLDVETFAATIATPEELRRMFDDERHTRLAGSLFSLARFAPRSLVTRLAGLDVAGRIELVLAGAGRRWKPVPTRTLLELLGAAACLPPPAVPGVRPIVPDEAVTAALASTMAALSTGGHLRARDILALIGVGSLGAAPDATIRRLRQLGLSGRPLSTGWRADEPDPVPGLLSRLGLDTGG